MHNVGPINHTLQSTHVGTQDLNETITAGVVVRVIDKEEKWGSDQCKARNGYVGGQ